MPTVALGAYLFGAAGVLIGQAVGGVVFAGISLWLARRVIRAEAGAAKQSDPFAREGRLMQLLHMRR